jgi:hypothetical protein
MARNHTEGVNDIEGTSVSLDGDVAVTTRILLTRGHVEDAAVMLKNIEFIIDGPKDENVAVVTMRVALGCGYAEDVVDNLGIILMS